MAVVLEISRSGPPEVLTIREVPTPTPTVDGVVVGVRSIGVNFADVMGRLGLYGPAPEPPYVPGFETSGVITEVGAGVTGWSVGDRVIAGTRFGGYASHITTPASRLMALPDGWSFDEGAGFFATYGTAYHALVTLGRIKAGSRVLIHAGAGGLGTAAIQIAKSLGAFVVATAGGDEKRRYVEEHGAAVGVDYRRDDWPLRVGDAVDGGELDFVLDSVLGPTFEPSFELLASMGHIVVCGAASFTPGRRRNWLTLAYKWLRLPRINPLSLIPTNRTVSGFNLLLLWESEDYMVLLRDALAELADSGSVRPVIGGVYPLEEGSRAHADLQSRRSRGKLILSVE